MPLVVTRIKKTSITTHMFALNHRDYGSLFFLITVGTCIPAVNVWYNQQFGSLAFTPLHCLHVLGFIAVQALLHLLMPYQIEIGDPAPSGARYAFHLNAWSSTFASLLLWGLATTWWGVEALRYPAEHAHEYTSPLFLCGSLLYLSWLIWTGAWGPTNRDGRPGPSWIRDILSGAELSPRLFGRDLKLFWIGHLGMRLWLMRNLSNVALAVHHQHNVWATVVVAAMQVFYILDWAYHENWYVHTIDIKQDRLGWILFVLSFLVMPSFYASFSNFLCRPDLSPPIPLSQSLLAALMYVVAYTQFRHCNNTKSIVRQPDQDVDTLKRKYGIDSMQICHGLPRQYTLLALSGGWQHARHYNYFCDLGMCLAMSLGTGFTFSMAGLSAHFYLFIMMFILFNRQLRDDVKCSRKYGLYWVEYCRRVPWKLIPGVY